MCLLIWLSSPAAAQDSESGLEQNPIGTSDPGVTCGESIEVVLDRLEELPQVELYLCIHRRQSAGPAILERLKEGTETDGRRNRLSRALAVWLLGQTHREFTGVEVRALSPADRRFLEEGIYASRGRETACTRVESPDPTSCSHGEAFKHFDWYRPMSNYSNRLLDETDRANLRIVRDPPPAPEEEVESAVATASATMEADTGTCGCGVGLDRTPLLALALLPLWARRRS